MLKKQSKTAKYIGTLNRYLKKLGVNTSIELTPEERATYEQWTELLTEEITPDTFTEFIRLQLVEQNQALRDAVKNGNDRAALLAVARIENYEALINLVERRERSREELAEHIEQLTKTL